MQAVVSSLQIAILISLVLGYQAFAKVKSSKVNAYTVLAPAAGVTASKVNAYTVLAPAAGVNVSKTNAYIVLAPGGAAGSVSVSKVNAYVVLATSATVVQPSVFIMTRKENSAPKPFDWRTIGLELTRIEPASVLLTNAPK